MNEESEAKFQARIVAYARSKGWFAEVIKKCGRRGFPDIFLSKPSSGIILIETKRSGEEARAQQEKRHRELRNAGVTIHVIDNFADLKTLLR